MNKWIKGLLIILVVIGILVFAGRITGAFQSYTVPTISGEPGLKKGTRFYASNLIKPGRFDLVCYKSKVGEEYLTCVHRLCGLPGDKIRIINGILYVNDKNADSSLRLAHNYIVPADELSRLDSFMEIKNENVMSATSDSSNLFIDDRIIKENKIKGRKYAYEGYEAFKEIKERYHHDWTPDNFGPVIVPADHYFFMGDNRDNSLDSRYTGFIDKANYVATALWRK